ncbi:MAG: LacI family DNA-binding transcriptional regulator [Sphaerochaeta sp.]|nr:LacI family DNA-binding transcriptional regulator [Sphaerochaeta sp.]
MADKPKKTTILDIAAIANVSTATVSRVLSNSDYPVKQEVREQILAIAKDLAYSPNLFSRMLKGADSKEIGVIIPSVANPFYSQLVASVEGVCIKHDYVPIICSSYNTPELQLKHIEMLKQRCVSGILISVLTTDDEVINQLKELDTNIVLFDQTFESKDFDSVNFDFYKAGYMATEYLVQNGHRNIAFATAPLERRSRKLFYKGYRKALEDYGIEFEVTNLVVSKVENDAITTDFHYQNGKNLAKMILEKEKLPDAIIAINDMTAFGIINFFEANEIVVPADISVMGFDNIPFSEMISPSLTTIEQPINLTGRLATEMLINKIEQKTDYERTVKLEPKLIERKSVRKKNKILRKEKNDL